MIPSRSSLLVERYRNKQFDYNLIVYVMKARFPVVGMRKNSPN